jgi:phage recombination protein Bet
MFLSQCKRTGLDPITKHIYGILRKDTNLGRKVLCIQTSIDGFRLIAERTGKRDGNDGPYWCGDDGCWRDVWLSSKPPVAAKFSVYRKGSARPFTAIAHWAEYAESSDFWKDMPAAQLAKCAESLALRMAFPQELSGLYTEDEMGEGEGVEVKAVQHEQLAAPTQQVAPQSLPATAPASAPTTPAVSTPAAVSHPAPTEPNRPVSIDPGKATHEQLLSLKALKQRLSITPEQWAAILGKRGVTTAADLPPSAAQALIEALRAKLTPATGAAPATALPFPDPADAKAPY